MVVSDKYIDKCFLYDEIAKQCLPPYCNTDVHTDVPLCIMMMCITYIMHFLDKNRYRDCNYEYNQNL